MGGVEGGKAKLNYILFDIQQMVLQGTLLAESACTELEVLYHAK